MTSQTELQIAKRKISKLKNEISMLNKLLSEVEGDWDQNGLYEDALNGTLNGNDFQDLIKPDKKYALWLKRRYNL